jgi:nucleoid-associated protein YgaU
VVERKPKLIAAGAVLTVGVGLAMLFRRTESQATIPTATETPLTVAITPLAPAHIVTPTQSLVVTPTAPLEGQLSPLASVPATNIGLTVGAGLPTSDVPRTGPPPSSTAIAADPFAQPLGTQFVPTPPAANASGGRPVYAKLSVADAATSDATASPYQIHVVHEGDSLERLAERYLTDSARSLELFDLNRDVLDNPHLLPIGAELKIPVEADLSAD